MLAHRNILQKLKNIENTYCICLAQKNICYAWIYVTRPANEPLIVYRDFIRTNKDYNIINFSFAIYLSIYIPFWKIDKQSYYTSIAINFCLNIFANEYARRVTSKTYVKTNKFLFSRADSCDRVYDLLFSV